MSAASRVILLILVPQFVCLPGSGTCTWGPPARAVIRCRGPPGRSNEAFRHDSRGASFLRSPARTRPTRTGRARTAQRPAAASRDGPARTGPVMTVPDARRGWRRCAPGHRARQLSALRRRSSQGRCCISRRPESQRLDPRVPAGAGLLLQPVDVPRDVGRTSRAGRARSNHPRPRPSRHAFSRRHRPAAPRRSPSHSPGVYRRALSAPDRRATATPPDFRNPRIIGDNSQRAGGRASTPARGAVHGAGPHR